MIICWLFVDILHFSTTSRLPYMKKYSPEKSTGPNIWIQLRGIITCRCLLCRPLILNNASYV